METAMSKRRVPKFINKIERESFWRGLCQELISSGLSKAEYCAKHDINNSSLYRWIGYFKDELDFSQSATHLNKPRQLPSGKKITAKSSFLPILVKQSDIQAAKDLASCAKAEIFLPNGIRLVVHQALNAALLSQLMQAMG